MWANLKLFRLTAAAGDVGIVKPQPAEYKIRL